MKKQPKYLATVLAILENITFKEKLRENLGKINELVFIPATSHTLVSKNSFKMLCEETPFEKPRLKFRNLLFLILAKLEDSQIFCSLGLHA